MMWFLNLPESLRVAAYYAGGEAAWPADEAIDALHCATELGAAVCGVEVWIPASAGPTIPTPYIYTWEGRKQRAGEGWNEFVRHTNAAAAEYIRTFCWDADDTTHKDLEPYFNFDVVLNETSP